MSIPRSLALLGLLTFALGAAAQDVVTVGTATASNGTADVPVYIRDTSGTPLGIDKPAGSHPVVQHQGELLAGVRGECRDVQPRRDHRESLAGVGVQPVEQRRDLASRRPPGVE